MANALCFCDGAQLTQTFCMHVFTEGCNSGPTYKVVRLLRNRLLNASVPFYPTFRFTLLSPNTCSYPWLAAHWHKMLLCLQHYPVYKDVTEPRGQGDALPY